MAKSVLHVVPHNDTWAVKREGNERASSTHDTQKEAIEAARELAKELDDIVIHRPDGTIRERVTYYGSNGTNGRSEGTATQPAPATAIGTADAARGVRTADVMSVGSRVSWEAVLAGSVVAVATYLALTLFALAVGLTARDWIGSKTFSVSAAAVGALILLFSLFLGGYVASRATAGENPGEGASYGVLVWGTTFLFLLLGGLGFGIGHLSGLRQLGPAADAVVSTERARQEMGLTDEQAAKYAALVRDSREVTAADPAKAAWWTFVGVVVSMLAAIAGGFVGAGPELAFRRAPAPAGNEPVAVAPRPA